MNNPMQRPSRCQRSSHGAGAGNDSLLPWADPYIAKLQRQYELKRDQYEIDRPDAVILCSATLPWTASDSPKPRTVNRLARTAVGWAIGRTPMRACTGLPGIR